LNCNSFFHFVVISLQNNDNIYQFLLKIDGKKGLKKIGFRRLAMSDRSSCAGGGSAAGGGGSESAETIRWQRSKTAGLSGMTFLSELFFFGFIVNFEDSSEIFTTLYIFELVKNEWSHMMVSKTKLKHELLYRVIDMFQHPANPNWLIVVSFTSVIVFEFDEGKMSLRQICELKGSDHGFQSIHSAHISRNGQTFVLHTYDQERETTRSTVDWNTILKNGIKSHSERFFTMSSTGSGFRFSQMSAYTHPMMKSVEDNWEIGSMPRTSISQDGRYFFVVFLSNIIVLDVTTGSQVCVHEFDAFKNLSCITAVSHINAHFLVFLSREGIITVFQFTSDLAEPALELKSRYESPKYPTKFSKDLSSYKCMEASFHAPLQFFVGGSTSGNDDGVIRLYNVGLNGEIQFLSEQNPSLAVYEITTNKFGTCARSKFFSDDSAFLSRYTEVSREPCHMILATSDVKPELLQSILNDSPIGLLPSGAFVLMQDGTIVSSNIKHGLTLSGASTDPKDAHKQPITSVFAIEVDAKLYVLSYSHSDGSIKIWSIQKRGETVHIRIVATLSTEDLVQKKGVKFLALDGQMLLIVTNPQEFLRFRVEIIGGIRADIRPILGPVTQISSGQICQGIAAVSPTHALIHVATSGERGHSLVLVSFAEGTAEMFKTIGSRESGKSPAALTPDFAVSAVVLTTVCSTALAAGGESCSFTPKYVKDGKLCDATILAIVPCEGGFICITANGFLLQFVYDAQQQPVYKTRIAVLDCALTPKCRLQVSGNTVMVCQPRDDGSFELRTFQIRE
jgi:WD40 repeat protein